jgi:tyrosine-protein phosphatase YwqE
MFSFFQKKYKEPFPFHLLKTDVHSHLLPGIDDGSPDVTTSLSLMKGMVELGFESFTATPHVMEDIWQNDDQSIAAAHVLLTTALKEIKMPYPIVAAAEYLVDGHLEQLLKNKIQLRTIRNNWVLIEVSFIQPPIQLHDIIFEMQLQGYQPVFAHPERYLYYAQHFKELLKVKDAGCILQSNLLSFSGYYGKEVKNFAEKLVDHNLIRLLGTDLHHQRHLQGLIDMQNTKSLRKIMEKIEN